MSVRSAAVIACAASCLALVGCGTSDLPEGSQSSTSSQNLEPSATFDPCAVGDDTIRDAGFNPASRTRNEASGDATAVCTYASDSMRLTLSNSKETFESFRDSSAGRREGLDVNARPAVIARMPDNNSPCELAMKNGDQIVSIQTEVSVQAKVWGMDRCGGIAAIAKAIEPELAGAR